LKPSYIAIEQEEENSN